MISLLMTDLKPAPSAPRFAAAGLTSVMRRGGGIDAANVRFCPLSLARLNVDAGRSNVVHRHVTEPEGQDVMDRHGQTGTSLAA
jgi:hypothetical protein